MLAINNYLNAIFSTMNDNDILLRKQRLSIKKLQGGNNLEIKGLLSQLNPRSQKSYELGSYARGSLYLLKKKKKHYWCEPSLKVVHLSLNSLIVILSSMIDLVLPAQLAFVCIESRAGLLLKKYESCEFLESLCTIQSRKTFREYCTKLTEN